MAYKKLTRREERHCRDLRYALRVVYDWSNDVSRRPTHLTTALYLYRANRRNPRPIEFKATPMK